MDSVGTGTDGGIGNLLDVQIALFGRRRADVICLVGHPDMERSAIGIGVDRDTANV
jgi:hypothetical protein